MKTRFILLVLLFAAATGFSQNEEHHHHQSSDATQKPGQQTTPPQPQVFFPMAEQPEMEMHHHGEIPEVMPQFPRLGSSQRVVSGPVYQIDELERMASEHNPTLSEAQRAVEAARARARQSGLYPNPTAGYQGDEIRGGSYGGGEQGFFVEQPFILGGKLRLNRQVGATEVKQAQAALEAQRQRVENDVRAAYYHVLAAQEKLAMERDLVAIAQNSVKVIHELANVGQEDETEVLETETEEQRMEISAATAQHVLRRQWMILTSAVGSPTLVEGSVAGRIDEGLPSVDEQQMLTTLLASSPEVKSAQAGVERAQAILARARREPIPDITLKGGLQNNLEQLNAEPGRQVGLQGFAEIGIEIPLWNRNQGGIGAARAELEAAESEVNRVQLMLRQHSAVYLEDYETAKLTAERYRSEILPRLERAYKLMTEQYGEMTASFSRVLTLQRMLYENEVAYIDTLDRAWTSSIILNGFLLQGGLMEADGAPPAGPAESTVPQAHPK